MSPESEVKSPKTLRHLKPLALVAALVLGGIAATGIASRIHEKEALTDWTNQRAIPTVATIVPQQIASTQPLVLPGKLAAQVNAPIYARVPGYLHAWYADIGTHVKAGQVLGEIDTPELDQQLQQARADLANSVANEKLAAITAKRWTLMLSQGSVAQQDTDEKTSALAAIQATVAASEANVHRLDALESFKKLVAPFDGVVTARNTDVGQLINVGSGSGQDLFDVADTRKLRLYVSVPQVDAAAIHSGMVATLTVPERPGEQFQARLVDTSNAISPSSGTLLVQLSVDNTQGLLFTGEYAQVRLALPGDPNAVTVPASALIFRENGLQVAVVDSNGHAQLKSVTVATDLGATVQLSSGIRPDDKVIDNPPDSLATGDPVRLAASHASSEPSHG